MKTRKKQIIILDDDDSSTSSSSSSSGGEESQGPHLPKNFFEDVFEEEEEEEVIDGDVHRDCIRRIGEQISRIKNIVSTPIIEKKSNQSSEKIPHCFRFRTPFMRVLVKYLYKHQKEGVDFLYKYIVKLKKGVILADFMGLGKSLQVVSIINIMNMMETERKSVLLVCPKVVISHWKNEFEKFNKWVRFDRIGIRGFQSIKMFTIPNRFSLSQRISTVKDWFSSRGILILSYGKFVRLWQMGYKDINDRFFSRDLLLVLDEGHRIRTGKHQSKTSLALSKVTTPQKIILTGYPLQNNLVEYWYLVSFILPSFLGDLNNFKRNIIRPISKGMEKKAPEEYVKKSKILCQIINNQLEPYILRRGIDLLRRSIPVQKREIVIFCKLTKMQHSYYNKIVDFIISKSRHNVIFWAYSFLTLLCNHPLIPLQYLKSKENSLNNLVDSPQGIESDINMIKDEGENEMKDEEEQEKKKKKEKIQYEKIPILFPKDIENLIEVLSSKTSKSEEKVGIRFESSKISILLHIIFTSQRLGDKVVVFTKSLMTLNFIENLLKQAKNGVNFSRLDGGMDIQIRQKRINKFNEPGSDIDVMLISTLSCCEGVNLHAANRVVLMDVNWNPSNDVEATSRVYRFGQKKHVSIYRLVSYGTIENRVHSKQVRKMKLLGMVCDDRNLNMMKELVSEKDLISKLPKEYEEYLEGLPDYEIDPIILQGGHGFSQDMLWVALQNFVRDGIVQVRAQESLLHDILEDEKLSPTVDEQVKLENEKNSILFDLKQNGIFCEIEDDDDEEEEIIIIKGKDRDFMIDEDEEEEVGSLKKKKKKKNLMVEIPSLENSNNDSKKNTGSLLPSLTISPNDFGSNWYEAIAKKKNIFSGEEDNQQNHQNQNNIFQPPRTQQNNNNNRNGNRNQQRTGRINQQNNRNFHRKHHNRRNNNNQQHQHQQNHRQQQEQQQTQNQKEFMEKILERQVCKVVDDTITRGAYFEKGGNRMTYRRIDNQGQPVLPPSLLKFNPQWNRNNNNNNKRNNNNNKKKKKQPTTQRINNQRKKNNRILPPPPPKHHHRNNQQQQPQQKKESKSKRRRLRKKQRRETLKLQQQQQGIIIPPPQPQQQTKQNQKSEQQKQQQKQRKKKRRKRNRSERRRRRKEEREKRELEEKKNNNQIVVNPPPPQPSIPTTSSNETTTSNNRRRRRNSSSQRDSFHYEGNNRNNRNRKRKRDLDREFISNSYKRKKDPK